MADEDLIMDEQDEAEEAPEPQKGSALKTYGLYGGIAIIMIVAAYFVTLKVVKPMFSSGDATTEEVAGANEDQKADEEEKSDDHGAPSGHGEAGGELASNVFMISDIIVNPAGTGGTRFLSTSIGIELETGKAKTLMTEKEAIIRDALITILSSQSIPELSDFKQREKLRLVIKRRVEKLLHTEDVAAVYFTEFVLQ